MTSRRLGRSGLHVLTVGLGCNNEPVRAASVTAGDAFDRVEARRAVAEARGLSLVELAIGWLAGQPTVGSVVAAASSPGQVRGGRRNRRGRDRRRAAGRRRRGCTGPP
jgi:aryl-alcohol dehydrogenase-like predicted oxidoreductase